MKIGIRAKLALLLAVVAFLPLLGALLWITAEGTRLRLNNLKATFLSVAGSEAQVLKASLARDIHQLELVLRKPEIVAPLVAKTTPEPADKVRVLDKAWPGLSVSAAPVAKVLQGPGSEALKRMTKMDDRFAEIFFTDRFGHLVASTNKTTDFCQEDEDWWKDAYSASQGKIVIPEARHDRSSDKLSISICLPILSDHVVVGVAKAVVKIDRWIVRMRHSIGPLQASIMLVRDDGSVILREGFTPLEQKATEWEGPIAQGRKSGCRTTTSGEIQAFAPIELDKQDVGQPVQMDWLSLVLYADGGEALRAVRRLSMTTLAVGLSGIVLLFIIGLYLVDRYMTRRVLRIAQAARRVAKGDLTSRVRGAEASEFPGGDEIGELSHDFNHMVERIEHSYQQLAAANDLKREFICVAGHEIKTPISYIMGMGRLLKDCQNPVRLQDAVQSMGAKAERLNKITQAMFKLMPEGVLPRALNAGEIEIPDLLAELRHAVHPFLEHRNQSLSEDVEGVKAIHADRQKLLDILENLVMNAIKFTPDACEVRLTVRASGDDEIVFTVSDQGEGIPETELPRLFEPFFSGGDVLKHSTGQSGYRKKGMGLGLAIVRYFVQLHHGRVEATTSSQGSTFSVTLPRRPTEEG